MSLPRNLFSFALALVIFTKVQAQIEVDHLSLKGFSATGFGGFINVAVPVTDADYVTADLGLNIFSSGDNHVLTAPLLAGYRFTLDRSGAGFYAEPNAGYSFGATDIQLYDTYGNYYDQKIAGPATGISFGYLFQPTGRIQFNLALRYEHIFGPANAGQDLFSFRISHAFTFGRRE